MNAHTHQMIARAIEQNPKRLQVAYTKGKSYNLLEDAVYSQNAANDNEIMFRLYFRACHLLMVIRGPCTDPDDDASGLCWNCQDTFQEYIGDFFRDKLCAYPGLDYFTEEDVYQVAGEIGKLPARQLVMAI